MKSKEKEQLFLLGNQKISILDPKSGKTIKKVSKINPFMKEIVSYNTSDNGIYFSAVLTSGDLLIWKKDSNSIQIVSGIAEFGLKSNWHKPKIYISNDIKRIIIITHRQKVFVWESDRSKLIRSSSLNDNQIIGSWSEIMPSKDIKTAEDNKELISHVRFVSNSVNFTIKIMM